MDENEITELGKAIVALQIEAVRQTLLIWKPKAEKIISTNSLDTKAIEHALDALCEVAFDDQILALFKKLCRYYYDIDPIATVEYVQFYREMWDSDEENKTDE
jgi:hypothetical protein